MLREARADQRVADRKEAEGDEVKEGAKVEAKDAVTPGEAVEAIVEIKDNWERV